MWNNQKQSKTICNSLKPSKTNNFGQFFHRQRAAFSHTDINRLPLWIQQHFRSCSTPQFQRNNNFRHKRSAFELQFQLLLLLLLLPRRSPHLFYTLNNIFTNFKISQSEKRSCISSNSSALCLQLNSQTFKFHSQPHTWKSGSESGCNLYTHTKMAVIQFGPIGRFKKNTIFLKIKRNFLTYLNRSVCVWQCKFNTKMLVCERVCALLMLMNDIYNNLS